MTRVRGGPEQVGGWQGIYEDAEPALAQVNGHPVGLMDACENFAAGKGGLEVRGGMGSVATLADADGVPMTSIRTVERYSQKGIVTVGHEAAGGKHYGFLHSPDYATQYSRTDLGWNSATPANARAVELFEKVYVADANRDMTNRNGLVSLDASGVALAVDGKLDGSTAEPLKPFAIEVYNNNLFIAGQDVGGASVPAMVRHATLGASPDSPDAWDANAYNIIGSRGDPVTAMRRGDNAMLIAKSNELYRLTGAGDGNPGWRYALQPIDNTEYVGVEWPGALCYAEGKWYGIGKAGPWVTDGREVEMIVQSRRRSWKRVIDLDKAVVRFYPDRRAVLFGVVEEGRSGIQTLWLWDVDREAFISDWTLPITVVDIAPISSSLAGAGGGAGGPAVELPSLAITHTSATLTTVSGTITPGDSTAATELWVDTGSGFKLGTTIAAGVTTFTLNDLPQDTQLQVKPRHLKNGIPGGYGAPVEAYTKVAPPVITAIMRERTAIRVAVVQVAGGASLAVTRDGASIFSSAAQASGTTELEASALSCGTAYFYSATAVRANWPAEINSATATLSVSTADCGGAQ